MEKYYPAVFLNESDGRYSVTFPDLPEAMTILKMQWKWQKNV